MTRSLVVGGNGFLGSHLVDSLVTSGRQVSVFDRFSVTPRYRSTEVERFSGDFLNAGILQEAVAGQDEVFHFLSLTTPITSSADPSWDMRTNVISTLELLRACVDAQVSKFFFASSGGSIYGDSQVVPHREDQCPLPMSPYAIGKLTIEGYLRYFATECGLRSTSLRIANPYGARQRADRPQGLIPIVFDRLLHNKSVVRFGNGSMVRDYIHVEDVADMVSSLASTDLAHDVYNIGSGIGTSVRDLFNLIEDVTDRRLVIEERPTPPTFVGASWLDTSRFHSEVPSVAPRALRGGLRTTWLSLVSQAL